MVAILPTLADLHWAVPDYTTLCRRQKTRTVQIPYRRADGPLNLLVDSMGIIDRRATPIIPIRKNRRPWKEDCPAACARNENLRPPGTTAGHSGSDGPDTMSEAGSRQRCAVCKHLASASPPETQTARPPKSRSESHS